MADFHTRLRAAIKATEYKYFGDYEMSDDQRAAVETLVEAAEKLLTTPTRAPVDNATRERVARAICAVGLGDPDSPITDSARIDLLWMIFGDEADAAIAALQEPPHAG